MKVSAQQWNKMVAFAFARRIRSLMARDGLEWSHPWKTAVVWNAEREGFDAIIKPGFVNGLDVTARTLVADESGERVFQDVPLTDHPPIALSSHREVSALVPAFFQAMGVVQKTPVSVDQIAAGITEVIEGLPEDEAKARRLLATDLVLRCTRPRTVVEWNVSPAETGSQAQFMFGVAQAKQTAKIVAMREWQAVQPSDTLTRLAGGTEDSGIDECLVATVFFVSPAGVGPYYELGADWQAFVRHELFWNAEHIVTGSTSPTPQPITLNLAGVGAAVNAQLIVNQILAAQNDADAAILQFIRATEIAGRITTPGQGTPAEFDTTARLDPPFPYKGRG